MPEIFRDTDGLPQEVSWQCETKNFSTANRDIPIMHKKFRYPKFSETLKGPTNYFGTVGQKKIEKILIIL